MVTINFYNEEMKPVPATTQAIIVHAAAPSGSAKIEFEKKGDSLVSKTKLPEGGGYTVVVQFRQTADAKPRNLRFKLDMAVCGERRVRKMLDAHEFDHVTIDVELEGEECVSVNEQEPGTRHEKQE